MTPTKAGPQTGRRPAKSKGSRKSLAPKTILSAAIKGIVLGAALWVVIPLIKWRFQEPPSSQSPSLHLKNAASKNPPPGSLEDPAFPKTDPEEATTDPTDPSATPASSDSGPDTSANRYEKTTLTVQRIVITQKKGDDRTKKENTLNIPVVYNTRLLGLSPADVHKSWQIVAELKEIRAKLAQLQTQEQNALRTWQEIHRRSLPYEILMADSPSLNQNEKLKDPPPAGTGTKTPPLKEAAIPTASPEGIQ